MREQVISNQEVELVRMGVTLALVLPLSRRIVKQFHATARMREDIRSFLRLRKLTVGNAYALNWNPNA